MMRQLVRRALWRTRLYDRLRRLRQERELRRWERRGRPSPTPPPAFKQRLVRGWAERLSLRVLLETGTYLGDMVAATRDIFEEVYSIELDRRLYERARWRFGGDERVHLVPGDSATTLSAVLPKIAGRPCLFWLDAHQMTGGVRGELVTPVRRELAAVLASDVEDCVVLVDDARLFTGAYDYPTLDEVEALVEASRPGWQLAVEDDVLRIHPRPSSTTQPPRHSGPRR